jgi:hypothetical protein
MGKGVKRAKTEEAKGSVVRVNVGGPSYRDKEGLMWEGDRGYHRGSWGCANLPATDVMRTTDVVSGTDDPLLFQTIRVGEEIVYRFDVPNGTYRVRLLFAEIYWESSDAEQQDVYVQKKKVLRGFNIFDEAGHDAAIEKVFTTKATGGYLEVRFVGVSLPMHSGARVCGIEVQPTKSKERGRR